MIINDNDVTDVVQDKAVSLDVWQRLYAVATKVRAMEPWLWMEETDVFGVQNPDKKDEVVFVSIMGLLGEYHAVALYLGTKAVSEFWRMQEKTGENEETANMILEIRQVHSAFGKKSELEPEEKRVVKELGLNFKGANAWPYFRSYRPGYFPWMVDAEEARLLILALEQILDIAPRMKENRRLLARKPGTCTYLVRVSDQNSVWRDEHRECPPTATTFRIIVPNQLMESVRAIPPSDLTFELDVAPAAMSVGKKGERPQIPYMMLVVDSASSFILGIELLTAEGAIENLWSQVPAKFLEMVKKHGIRPGKIALRTPWLFMVMDGICKELGIEIKPDPELQALKQIRRDLERFNLR